eukprot:PhF_6_TR12326/c0_g1_i1/m.19585
MSVWLLQWRRQHVPHGFQLITDTPNTDTVIHNTMTMVTVTHNNNQTTGTATPNKMIMGTVMTTEVTGTVMITESTGMVVTMKPRQPTLPRLHRMSSWRRWVPTVYQKV